MDACAAVMWEQVAEGFSEVIQIRTIPANFKTPFEESMFFSFLTP